MQQDNGILAVYFLVRVAVGIGSCLCIQIYLTRCLLVQQNSVCNIYLAVQVDVTENRCQNGRFGCGLTGLCRRCSGSSRSALFQKDCDFSVVAVALLVSAVVVVSLEDTVVCVLLSVVPGFDSEVVTPLSGRPEMVNFTDTDLETLTFDAISETLLVGVPCVQNVVAQACAAVAQTICTVRRTGVGDRLSVYHNAFDLHLDAGICDRICGILGSVLENVNVRVQNQAGDRVRLAGNLEACSVRAVSGNVCRSLTLVAVAPEVIYADRTSHPDLEQCVAGRRLYIGICGCSCGFVGVLCSGYSCSRCNISAVIPAALAHVVVQRQAHGSDVDNCDTFLGSSCLQIRNFALGLPAVTEESGLSPQSRFKDHQSWISADVLA